MSGTVRDAIYTIQYGDLSNDELNQIIGAVKYARALNGRKAARTLELGSQVRFNGRRGPVVGVLTEVKIKNAVVVAGQTRWKVPLSMLEAVA